MYQRAFPVWSNGLCQTGIFGSAGKVDVEGHLVDGSLAGGFVEPQIDSREVEPYKVDRLVDQGKLHKGAAPFYSETAAVTLGRWNANVYVGKVVKVAQPVEGPLKLQEGDMAMLAACLAAEIGQLADHRFGSSYRAGGAEARSATLEQHRFWGSGRRHQPSPEAQTNLTRRHVRR